MALTLRQEDLVEFLRVRVSLSRRSFWQYCVTTDPDFYKPDRAHLKLLCDTLQGLHDGTIVRRGEDEPWRFLEEDEDLDGLEVCRKCIINMPPRFGKTRTVVLFEAWVLGKNKLSKFVTASYNDDSAADISRYVRDEIAREKQDAYSLVYSDIFPHTRLKGNDKSVSRWAVEGSYFSYIGTGPGGTVTGKGADWLLVDDPVKNAEIAFNAPAMRKINSWIFNTLLSRTERGAKTLIVHTRWPNGDITDAYMANTVEYKKFFHLTLRAESETGELLCDEILNREDYDSKKRLMDPTIFEANYNQNIIRPMGALYKEFKTYEKLPEVFDRAICFIDTAGDGTDFLCAVMGLVALKHAWVTEVVYTDLPVDDSLPMVAEAIVANGIKEIRVEANNGGDAYARELDRILLEDYNYPVAVETVYETSNKGTRIISNAAIVQDRIMMPELWEDLFPQYGFDMMHYLRIGRNLHDDAPDATTGFYLYAFDGGVILA